MTNFTTFRSVRPNLKKSSEKSIETPVRESKLRGIEALSLVIASLSLLGWLGWTIFVEWPAQKTDRLAQDKNREFQAWTLLTKQTGGDAGKSNALKFLLASGSEIAGLNLNCSSISGPIETQPATFKVNSKYMTIDRGECKSGLKLSNISLTSELYLQSTGPRYAPIHTQNPKFTDSSFNGAEFVNWSLENPLFINVDMNESYFENVNIPSSSFVETNLIGSIIYKSNLHSSKFFGGKLTDSHFVLSDLSESEIRAEVEPIDPDHPLETINGFSIIGSQVSGLKIERSNSPLPLIPYFSQSWAWADQPVTLWSKPLSAREGLVYCDPILRMPWLEKNRNTPWIAPKKCLQNSP